MAGGPMEGGGRMASTVGIGMQDFGDILRRDNFYVDKTWFIRDWWESTDAVTLATRPRRFGKTLMMSMLGHSFSIGHKDDGWMFEGMDIWKDEKYWELQGTDRPADGPIAYPSAGHLS